MLANIKYTTYVCDKTFLSQDLFKLHRTLHTKRVRSAEVVDETSQEDTCEECHIVFAKRSLFLRHLKTNPQWEQPPCRLCGYKCYTKTEWRRHLSTHLQKTTSKACHVCGQVFTHNDLLNKHLMITHLGVMPYKCKRCNEKFYLESQLVAHMASHSSHYRVELRHKCLECGDSFAIAAHLKRNAFTKSSELHFQCKVCEMPFKDVDKLINHSKLHGSAQDAAAAGKYRCVKCGEVFKCEDHLKRHVDIHSCEKKYKCHMCWVSFDRAEEIKRHTRKHVDGKTQKCLICDKTWFLSVMFLKTHMRTHAGSMGLPR